MKKKISAAVALLMCGTMMASCTSGGGDNGQDVTTSAEAAAEADSGDQGADAAETVSNEVDPGVPVDLAAGVTDKMYSRAILNEGNLARLAHAMKKAQNGEKVTVGVIGGSITQGSLASNPANCYASKFADWWKEKFPRAEINFVNAGIGGTNSYLGVHRVDGQLLAYDPDVVIVEFSVNDSDKIMNKYSYDSLVRKILGHSSDPAVMLLFTTQENGTSLQDVHKEIGTAYDLPMISYREVVYPEVAAGTLDWKAISPDNIHPNDAGHDIINQLISRYLDSVYDRLDAVTEEPSTFTAEPYTKDYYADAKMYGAADITATASEGFEVVEKGFYEQFPGNWKTESGGSLTFEVECKCLGVFYMKTTDGKSGMYEVYVDGESKGLLNGDFTGGWGNYGETQQVIMSNELQPHTVEIKPAGGSDDKGMTIIGLMIS
ncbi:MAG: SGNH/GDSL hydrolase family protein [Oscillospiraceae bacterium]|nr:SGNH/GDSL hydrolase family protein [Oscillospiraceae bacterium]